MSLYKLEITIKLKDIYDIYIYFTESQAINVYIMSVCALIHVDLYSSKNLTRYTRKK